MGTVASSWFPAGMTENAGNEFKRPKKSSRKSVQIGHTSASPNKTIEHSYGITWNECLRHVMVYLDSNTMSILSSVSRCWSQHFDHRGSRASSEAISNLLGREYGQRLSLLGKAETESTAVTDWEISPRRYWTQACDLLVGHLHSNVPRGSQSSTSMALALVSDFMMCAQTVQLPENVVHVDVNRLCSDSYLLAFTAITIAIKVEEGLYFEADSIPFPREVPNVCNSTLSLQTVIEAEQTILKVLKMSVPVCYFAQFARPLWYRMRSVDEEQSRFKVASKRGRKRLFTSLPLNSKLSIFRFVHHASARHMDCNSGGKAIHPSVVALCVTIFSVSLSHLINSSARKDHQQLHDSNKSVDRFKRVEKVQGMPCAHVSQGKYPYEEVPQATPSSLDQHVQSRSRSICSENTIPSSSDHKSPRHCQRSKEDVNLKKKDKNSTSDMSLVSMKSASCFTAIEVFGKELLVALIFEDLKDKEGQGQMNMHPWIHCVPKRALQSLNMTLHALLAHLEELSRLKVHILYQRPALANDSVASSTRSTDGLSSTMPIVTATSDLSVETFGGGKKNVVRGAPSAVVAEKDSLSVETLRILFNTNRPGKGMREGEKIINALCSISQREMSSMQTEINSALQVAFSRHLLLAVPPPYSSPFSTPPADNDAVRRAVISESPYKQGKNYREGKAPKRRLSSSNLLTAPDLLGVRKLETN